MRRSILPHIDGAERELPLTTDFIRRCKGPRRPGQLHLGTARDPADCRGVRRTALTAIELLFQVLLLRSHRPECPFSTEGALCAEHRLAHVAGARTLEITRHEPSALARFGHISARRPAATGRPHELLPQLPSAGSTGSSTRASIGTAGFENRLPAALRGTS